MVNQNPQPEIYSTRHNFANGATQGTVNTQQIYTSQSFNEEVRIYGVMVNIVNKDGDSLAYGDLPNGEQDFDISIQAGPNRIPSEAFSASRILRAEDRTLAFSSPVLILHRQPLQVTVEYRSGTAISTTTGLTVLVSLISEMYIRQE